MSGAADLSGTDTVTVVAGLARFDNVLINTPETGNYDFVFVTEPPTFELRRPVRVDECNVGMLAAVDDVGVPSQGLIGCTLAAALLIDSLPVPCLFDSAAADFHRLCQGL